MFQKRQAALQCLQSRINNLPRESQKLVLVQLIYLYLRPGKIFVDKFGLVMERKKPRIRYPTRQSDHDYPPPDVAIFRALNKHFTEMAQHVLYQCNTFVIQQSPQPCTPNKPFLLWQSHVLNRVESVEITPFYEDNTRSPVLVVTEFLENSYLV